MKKSGYIQEFKEFIARGNVIDLAVGVVIGGAFTAIVTSLVNDIIMPFVGILIGGINFKELKYVVKPATDVVAETAIYYGSFIQCIVNFTLIAIVVFALVKFINALKRNPETGQT